MNRILVPESSGEEIRQSFKTCRRVHKCTKCCGSIAESTPRREQLLGKVAALTLGPEGGSFVCRWGWHEQKHRRGRTPRGFGLVKVKRMGGE